VSYIPSPLARRTRGFGSRFPLVSFERCSNLGFAEQAPFLFLNEKMKFIEALIVFVSIAGGSSAFQSPVPASKAVSSRGRNTVVSGSALLAATLDGTAVNVPTGARRKKTKQVS